MAIHQLAKPHRSGETQFITHKTQVRSLALARLIEVVTSEPSKEDRTVRRAS